MTRSLILLLGLASCRSGTDRDAAVRRLLADYDGARPGACVLARHAGSEIYRGCVGLAELETGRPATPETSFRLASVTKQFTATAVLLLVAEGRLTTATPLREIFPDFPAWADAITIHHLLTHTSGLPDYEDLMPADDGRQILDAGVLALLRAQDSTSFPPGSAFRYSNSGYAVLAQVVERVSGQRFEEFLDARIFDPLGMGGSVAHVEGQTTVPHRAFGYSRTDDGSWTRTDQSSTSAVLGDGGIYTSLRDLDRWLEVVEGRDSLLPAALAAGIFAEATRADGPGIGYGYGWFIGRIAGGRRYHHEGSTIGFRNAIERLPDEDLSLVFLSNRNEIDPGLVDSLLAIIRAARAR